MQLPVEHKLEHLKCVVARMTFLSPDEELTMEKQFRQDDFAAITPSDTERRTSLKAPATRSEVQQTTLLYVWAIFATSLLQEGDFVQAFRTVI